MNKKIKKITLGLLSTIGIIALSLSNVSAMGGNGQGGGNGNGLGKKITSEEKNRLQSMDEHDRQEYINELKAKYNIKSSGNNQGNRKGNGEGKKGNKEIKGNHSNEDMLRDIEKQDLNAIEIDLLEKQYEEEMMANELYTSFYEMYGIDTFKNIAESEAKHMASVKALLDRYDIEVPTNYNHIKDLYNSLKESGSKSLFDALEVGVQIEFVDIDDIVTAIKSTNNDDIKVVFTNIGGASYNHLRGFLKAIDNNGYETNLDWSKYLEKSDLSIKGPIKYKLAEKLETDGVELPMQVSSDTMKNKKCDDNHGYKKGNTISNKQIETNKKIEAKQSIYKDLIINKYIDIINKLSYDKLVSIIPKIDSMKIKTQLSSNYTEEKKINTIAMLNALKEIIEDIVK